MSILIVTERSPDAKAKQLRRQGMTPLAVVAKTGGTRLFQAPLQQVRLALSKASGAGMLDVQVEGGEKMQAIVKGIDHDVLTRSITHVTFMTVSQQDVIKADLPVIGAGTPPAVDDGTAVLVHPTDHVTVRGKVTDIPDHLEVDISHLEVNHSIYAHDIQLPKGLELMSSGEAAIFSLQPAVDLVAELEAEQAAEAEAAAASEEEAGDDAAGNSNPGNSDES